MTTTTMTIMEILMETYPEWKVNNWMLNPTFSAESILSQPVPNELGDEGTAAWEEFLGAQDAPQFLPSHGLGVSAQSALAADSVLKLEKAKEASDSTWPTLLVLLSECHFLLNSTSEARILAQEAQTLVGVGNDEVLDECVNYLRIIEYNVLRCEEESDGMKLVHYTFPPTYEMSDIPFNLVDLQRRWALMKTMPDGVDQYARLACVETNVLEGVIDLDRDSAMELARRGFSTGSIPSIGINRKPKILQILEDTQRVYTNIKIACCDNKPSSSCFTKDFVLKAHKDLIGANKIDVSYDYEGEETYSYIPAGRFRAAASSTTHGNEKIIFCPPSELDEAMDWYLQRVCEILSAMEKQDPFRVAAWIQFAFVRIHPFADGNGRMSRLLSSIPLIANDLPPVYVSSACKSQYFAILNQADKDGKIDRLARFLQDQAFEALGQFLNENNVDVEINKQQ